MIVSSQTSHLCGRVDAPWYTQHLPKAQRVQNTWRRIIQPLVSNSFVVHQHVAQHLYTMCKHPMVELWDSKEVHQCQLSFRSGPLAGDRGEANLTTVQLDP